MDGCRKLCAICSCPFLSQLGSSCLFHAAIQILPKHALDAVLYGLCEERLERNVQAGAWGEGPNGGDGSGNMPGRGARSCVWTELTMPVITAALNLKPALSDNTIAVLVRRVEAASEQPQLQVGEEFVLAHAAGVLIFLLYGRSRVMALTMKICMAFLRLLFWTLC